MLKNTFKTTLLLAGLGGLMVLIGSAFGRGGAIIGLVLGLVMTAGSYWFSDKIAIAASRAKPVTEREAPQLYRMTHDLTQRAGLPMPRLYVIPSAQPNAFATGRNPQNAAVAVTQGITQVMTEEELKGVIAHELAHVKHRDILISSVAAAIGMSITFVARMAMWGAMFGGAGGSNDDEGGSNIFGLLAMMILAPLAAMLIQMAISRSREFEADRGAAEMLGTGEPLASALGKLESAAKQIPMNVNPAMEQAFIVNPFSGRKPAFAGLFSTHPPAEERIERLRAWRPGL
jgi:heat shock protein HtpX